VRVVQPSQPADNRPEEASMGATTRVDADAGVQAEEAARATNVIPNSFPSAERMGFLAGFFIVPVSLLVDDSCA
jgi:hypothetical protein